MQTKKINLLNSIYSIIEENNDCKYMMLHSIIELLNDQQIDQIEDIIVNQFEN